VALPILYVFPPKHSKPHPDFDSFNWAMTLLGINRFLIHIRSSEDYAEDDDIHESIPPISRASADAARHGLESFDSGIELPSFWAK
jgi:hypothetical protein